MPPADKPPKKLIPSREEKLAQALRANLRRRKAAPPAQAPKAGSKNNDEG
jgi:hypothetical protein